MLLSVKQNEWFENDYPSFITKHISTKKLFVTILIFLKSFEEITLLIVSKSGN